MKVVKIFVATLVLVLGIGGIFLYRKDIVNKVESFSGVEKESNEDNTVADADSKQDSISDQIKKKVVKEITEKVVEEAVKSYGGDSAEKIQQVMDSVSEEDKEKVTEILTDNLSLDSIGDVKSYISNSDVDGLKEYAEEKLTEEQYSELTGIFEKYSDEIKEQMDGAAD